MATTITMPQLGETVTEGTVAQWLKKVGDSVEKYEAFLEVSTDKVNAEVPSPVTGVIKEVLVKEGDTVPIGTAIAVIEEAGAAAARAPESASAPPATHAAMANSVQEDPIPGFNIPQLETAAAKPASAPPQTNGRSARGGSEGVIPSSYGAPGGLEPDAAGEDALRKASPAVRKLAREHHIDIRTLRGSGANGRVTADDVLSAARMGPSAAVGHAIATVPAPASGTSTYAEPIPGTLVPLTQARRIIAERMVESVQTAPHAWTMASIDVTGVWKWRAREKDRFERETGYKLTLLPFFIRAVVESLAAYPLMNAKFTPSTSSGQAGIYVNKDVNIGIAIGLPATLVVPVIKNADKLSIKGLALAAGTMIDKARRGKLSADDLAGGTFTVNNNGTNGSWASAPIINAGQAGIITMETVEKRLLVRDDDSFAPRYVMNSCLSLDHRVVDGYVASGFLADLKKRLERMTAEGATL
ncbi:MAG TPA: dihydrolipoamide acetyltransferase family protein [Candidatus Baltobacteraceae bacterium]|nr:dihydrolipoamide acetyltransferase family protein [Candidatus Baltobacteraceae bacterium]